MFNAPRGQNERIIFKKQGIFVYVCNLGCKWPTLLKFRVLSVCVIVMFLYWLLGCFRVFVDTEICNHERSDINIWVSFEFLVLYIISAF